MLVRIYQAEKDAGIDFQMNKEGSSSSFVTAQIKIGNINEYFDGMSVPDLIKATSTVQTVEELIGQEQPDLALVVAILVSTGWNLNDDIFTPEEVWKARNTPLHKPMNDNHKARSILGHIVKTRALDKFGHEIEVEDGESPPNDFDIEVAGVLYRAFPELSDRIDEIIKKANSGEMFVSMESWFPNFDYGLVDSATGEIKLIERNERTAFLTKHLKVYGGTGKYQDYKIGRVLRDMIFGAQGFVDEPANPESVIKVAAEKKAVSRSFVTAELSDLSEGGVEDVDEKQLKELQAKLEEVQTSLAAKENEVAELKKVAEESKAKGYDEQITALDTKVEELTSSIAEMSDKVKAAEAEKTELQKQLDEVTERAEKSEAELETIRKDEAARDRLVKLSKVKKVDDEEATLAELRDMPDETFEAVLKYAGNDKNEGTVSEESEEKTDASESDKDEKTAQEKEKEAEQAEAALDSVKETDSPDFNATENAEKSETEKWVATARALCGRKDTDENEGGE